MNEELAEFLHQNRACSGGIARLSFLGAETLEQAWEKAAPADLVWGVTRQGVMSPEQRRLFLVFVLESIEDKLTDKRSKGILDKLRTKSPITAADKDAAWAAAQASALAAAAQAAARAAAWAADAAAAQASASAAAAQASAAAAARAADHGADQVAYRVEARGRLKADKMTRSKILQRYDDLSLVAIATGKDTPEFIRAQAGHELVQREFYTQTNHRKEK